MAKKKSSSGSNAPIYLILASLAVIAAVFLAILGKLNLLPTRYFAAICIGVVAVLLVLFLLLRRFRVSFRCILGIILTIAFCGGLIWGGYLLKRTSDTIKTVTETPAIQVTEMGVYVKTADPAQTLNDTASYRFGIMDKQNRDVTDAALQQLATELGTTLTVSTYGGPTQLVSALLKDEVSAILFNSAFFDMVAANSDYAHVSTDLRELTKLEVKTEIPVQKEESSPSAKQDDSEESEEETPNDILTLYISGVDSYGSISNGGNGDVNILAVINTTTHQAVLISTPRDYHIPLSNSDGELDKLTHAGFYGVTCSMETLEMLYGVDIDNYFRVNFSGFRDIINAIGGITLINDESFRTNQSDNYYFPEGEIYLDGYSALAYVRERHAFGDGDMARGRHQMMVIKAVIDKITSPEILTNFDDLLLAIEGNFETSLPYETISELVKEQLDSDASWNIVSYAASGYVDWQYCWTYGEALSVVTPDYDTVDTCKELIRQVMNGEIPAVPED